MLKKGKKSHFGYKLFAVVDEDGFFRHTDMTPANREFLREKGLKDGIMHKVARNKPLGKRQKQLNRLISEIRYIVEKGFDTFKRPLDFARASYFGLARVHAQARFKLMCLNLTKATNMIELIPGASPSKPSIGMAGGAQWIGARLGRAKSQKEMRFDWADNGEKPQNIAKGRSKPGKQDVQRS